MELTPQQLQFKEFYLNPNSETFGNAKRSAIRAGYDEEYASQITARGTAWMLEIVRDYERLQKAEKVLDKTLEMEADDPAKLRIQTDVAKFVAKGMAKHKYSERVEKDITSGGQPINLSGLFAEAIDE